VRGSARPLERTVAAAALQGVTYFPDWGGKLWKLDADTGAVVWSHSISDYTGIPNDISRTSPSPATRLSSATCSRRT
jgi:outer membrane protein assembly factor BamB